MLELCLIYLLNGFIEFTKIVAETAIQYPLLVLTVALLTIANIKAKHIFN